MRLSPERIDAILHSWPVARLATLRGDGAPHQVPIVFARAAGGLWSPIDAKPKADREPVRVANVRRDPRVCLLLDEYAPDWSRLWWIRIDGRAAVREPERPEEEPDVREALHALRSKYPQYATTAVLRFHPTLLRIEPETVRSWCAAGAGARFC